MRQRRSLPGISATLLIKVAVPAAAISRCRRGGAEARGDWSVSAGEQAEEGEGGGGAEGVGAGEEVGTETDPSVLLLHHLGRESWRGIRRRPASLARRCRLGAKHPAAPLLPLPHHHPPTTAPPRLAQLGSARPGSGLAPTRSRLLSKIVLSPTELVVWECVCVSEV